MDRYLIETPHTASECLDLIKVLNAQGYLWNFDWGCKAGIHSGWAIIDAENEAEARLAVDHLPDDGFQVLRRGLAGAILDLDAEPAGGADPAHGRRREDEGEAFLGEFGLEELVFGAGEKIRRGTGDRGDEVMNCDWLAVECALLISVRG